ncbi:MAG: YeeE/YedE family protein [Halocynthiibacter sp.]
MFETFGFIDTTPKEASLWFGLGLGLLFGILALITGFCLRRGIVGASADRPQALGIWAMALAVATLGTQGLIALDLIDFSAHRFFAESTPILAVILGGLAFGVGMVLTRGCIGRLSVLSGTGNLRALLVVVVFAIIAHATLKGVLAPVRTAISSITVELSLPFATGIAAIITIAALGIAIKSRAGVKMLTLAAVIGALIPLGYFGTGYVLFDEFDVIAVETMSFTSTVTETLFFGIASTSITAGFGVAFVTGTLLGSFAWAIFTGRFQWQSFETPAQTGQYMLGAALMGVGAVLAGGCTIGAGLAGVPLMAPAAMIALVSIIVGAKAADRFNASSSLSAAPSATPVKA